MGIGMMLIVDEAEADIAIGLLEEVGEKAYHIGRVEAGNKEVVFE